MKNGRLLQIIIALISFIIGGGATAAISYGQYTKLDTKIDQQVTIIRTEEHNSQNDLLLEIRSINKRLSRIEGRLEITER